MQSRSVDCFIDLSLSEDLKMSFVLPMGGEHEVEWRRVNRELLTNHPMVVVGSSDGGAHLNAFVGADYTTRFLSEWVPNVLTIEAAIHRLTEEPANRWLQEPVSTCASHSPDPTLA